MEENVLTKQQATSAAAPAGDSAAQQPEQRARKQSSSKSPAQQTLSMHMASSSDSAACDCFSEEACGCTLRAADEDYYADMAWESFEGVPEHYLPPLEKDRFDVRIGEPDPSLPAFAGTPVKYAYGTDPDQCLDETQ